MSNSLLIVFGNSYQSKITPLIWLQSRNPEMKIQNLEPPRVSPGCRSVENSRDIYIALLHGTNAH